MNWKNSDLRKFLIWALTFFEEDHGKASTKRFIAWVLTATCAYSIVHTVKNFPPDVWGNSITFLITIFTFIASLLTLTYIPTRKEDIKP